MDKGDFLCILTYMKPLQLSSPHIIAMVGVPGAGKSQFAAEFSEMFHAPYLDSGILTALSDDEAAVNYASGTLLKELMKTHQTIVFEGATEKRAWRVELAKTARAAGYKILFVWVQTDLATAKMRWLKANDNDEAAFDAKIKQFSSPHPSEPCVVISGRHTYNTQARTLLKRLADVRPNTTTAPTQPQAAQADTPKHRPQRPVFSRIRVS